MSQTAREPQVLVEVGPSRRMVLATVLRVATSIAALVTLYYVLPLNGLDTLSAGVRLLIGLLVFVALAVWQVRALMSAAFPVLRAVEVLANLVPLFILVFAAAYYVMAADDPSSFTSPLTRTDALYFTITVFATVGFGDIVARTESARVAVMLQMVGDLVVIGVLIRAVTTAAGRRQRQRLERRRAADDVSLRT